MEEPAYISLFQLQDQIKASLSNAFPFPTWIVAEIGELKVNYSGHCYLELIEKGGKNGIPSARANGVIWKSHYGSINSYFRSVTGSDLAVGMRVMLKVGVSYHELYGLSLQIGDINPSFTLGDVAKQREMTIKQLQDDGVYDMNRELELESPIQKIAVISSQNAAGFQDFCKELAVSDYKIEISLYDAFMQGAGAENSIIGALTQIIDSQCDYDAVVVIRGGGSQSDLSCFNSYALCSHLAQFPVPIIAGIGHDKDQSVADLVACLSLKTPTAVARFLIDQAAEFDEGLNYLYDQLIDSADAVLKSYSARLEQFAFSLSRVSTRFSQVLELRLQSLQNSLNNSALSLLKDQRRDLAVLEEKLTLRPTELLREQRRNIEKCEILVQASHPDRIMAKGFSVVKVNGEAVSDSGLLGEGQQIQILMSKGEISAVVDKKIS